MGETVVDPFSQINIVYGFNKERHADADPWLIRTLRNLLIFSWRLQQSYTHQKKRGHGEQEGGRGWPTVASFENATGTCAPLQPPARRPKHLRISRTATQKHYKVLAARMPYAFGQERLLVLCARPGY